MTNDPCSVRGAIAAGCLAVALVAASGFTAAAQGTAPQPAPAQTTPPPTAAEPQVKEISLTEKQVKSVLAGYKEIDAVAARLPDDPSTKPDSKILKQADDVAKKHGFADFGEYSDVVETIATVLAGIDSQTKTYVGPEAELKAQIAAVQADTKISAQDKKQALDDLNEALKSPGPVVKNQGNIDLVIKHYDKLSDALEDDE
jgi:hypothetical protein